MKQFYLLFLACLLFIACNTNQAFDSQSKPDDNRFTKVVLTQGMDEPMTMDFLPNNQIIIIERKGAVKILDEESGLITTAAMIPVNTKYTNREGRTREAEEGLMGVVAHPDFEKNNWIFLYYADPDVAQHTLARWELKDNILVESTKTIVMNVPTQREECCHTGGGMVFDKAGNLYLTVGNNTVNPRSGASNLDERPGEENSDDQRGPSNSNDLRGKILRIHPEDDGSYTIPVGNLFPVGTPNTRPEIYTMGHRNPWRVSLDSQTGFLYWGEVGPDANIDSIWGPKGYDEFNQAKEAGFFGWPYFIGPNRPYNEVIGFEDDQAQYGALFDVTSPINNSINNTGINELPKPIPAFISYPYGPSAEFPLVGSSGRSATGGPVFRAADFANAPRPFPDYYEGKWFIVDFMRDWIMSVTMDAAGDYVNMERFLPNQNFSAAIDMDFGPSGDLYVLEYGDAWFRKNSNSKLVKVQYNAGNRPPIVQASADKVAGTIPFRSQFSSEGTIDYDDYDKNALEYQWEITDASGETDIFTDPNPAVNFDKAGVYEVALYVTDSKAESTKAVFEVVSGNEPPVVEIDFKGANRSFYFGDQTLDYAVSIADKEDGVINEASQAAITFDYVPAGFDPIEVASNQTGADMLAVDAVAKHLIESKDCKSCHQYETKSIGPSYAEVAKTYKKTAENRALLIDRVINGSSGVWGEHAMAAHPELTEDHAGRIVDYILGLVDVKPTVERLAMTGLINPSLPKGEDGKGVYLLRAAYQDKGAVGLKSLSGEAIVSLRNPILFPPFTDVSENTQYLTTPSINYFVLGPQAHLTFLDIDLTGIRYIECFVQASPRVEAAGGFVELRLDSPTGKLVATSQSIKQKSESRRWWEQSDQDLTPEEQKIERRKDKQVLTLAFDPINEAHDIYFVFKNADIMGNQILMGIKEIEFYNTDKSGLEL